ncbi:MAG: hypothetical protein OXF25_11210 [Cyanobacteria bacterium MAG CAR3_bin_5]|nr:hypothetical protein [Cyanobacteria bacterium MAG CAR3_bin_5]
MAKSTKTTTQKTTTTQNHLKTTNPSLKLIENPETTTTTTLNHPKSMNQTIQNANFLQGIPLIHRRDKNTQI